MRDGSEYRAGYVEGLGKLFRDIKDRSYPIVIDAANGAASSYVGPLFSEWSGGVTFMANDPDGTNIHKNVGVTHIETLASKVRETGATLGIAYDGDTDRVLMCDGKGRVLDGDIMLWVIGRWLSSRGELGAGVVATVMSNMVLEDLLAQEGIKVFRCPVGDRYVLDTMKREGARIGGEQSGHIIALDYANTGDGLCSGILFLKAVGELGEDVSTLVDRFDRYPQVLRNMKVKDKNAVMSSPLVDAAAKEAERLLAGKGRMLLRPSGTGAAHQDIRGIARRGAHEPRRGHNGRGDRKGCERTVSAAAEYKKIRTAVFPSRASGRASSPRRRTSRRR